MSARNIIGKQSLVGVQPIINNNHFTFVKLLEENWDSIYDELTEILISSGFQNIKSINLFNGIVAIHTGYKI